MFQFTGLSLPLPINSAGSLRGCPISGISGSTPVSSSPEHFVGCHALHRLWVPRYPPEAYNDLILQLCTRVTTFCYRANQHVFYLRKNKCFIYEKASNTGCDEVLVVDLSLRFYLCFIVDKTIKQREKRGLNDHLTHPSPSTRSFTLPFEMPGFVLSFYFYLR